MQISSINIQLVLDIASNALASAKNDNPLQIQIEDETQARVQRIVQDNATVENNLHVDVLA